MKVSELIDFLEIFHPGAEVYVTVDLRNFVILDTMAYKGQPILCASEAKK